MIRFQNRIKAEIDSANINEKMRKQGKVHRFCVICRATGWEVVRVGSKDHARGLT